MSVQGYKLFTAGDGGQPGMPGGGGNPPRGHHAPGLPAPGWPPPGMPGQPNLGDMNSPELPGTHSAHHGPPQPNPHAHQHQQGGGGGVQLGGVGQQHIIIRVIDGPQMQQQQPKVHGSHLHQQPGQGQHQLGGGFPAQGMPPGYNQQQSGADNAGGQQVPLVPGGHLSHQQRPRVDEEHQYVANVKFRHSESYFKATATMRLNLHVGDYVIVDGDRGDDLGQVLSFVDRKASSSPSPQWIQRVANPSEVGEYLAMETEEQVLLHDARKTALRVLSPLDRSLMDIKHASLQFDRRKMTLWYSSPRRITFTPLAQALSTLYKMRIWFEKIDEPAGAVAVAQQHQHQPHQQAGGILAQEQKAQGSHLQQPAGQWQHSPQTRLASLQVQVRALDLLLQGMRPQGQGHEQHDSGQNTEGGYNQQQSGAYNTSGQQQGGRQQQQGGSDQSQQGHGGMQGQQSASQPQKHSQSSTATASHPEGGYSNSPDDQSLQHTATTQQQQQQQQQQLVNCFPVTSGVEDYFAHMAKVEATTDRTATEVSSNRGQQPSPGPQLGVAVGCYQCEVREGTRYLFRDFDGTTWRMFCRRCWEGYYNEPPPAAAQLRPSFYGGRDRYGSYYKDASDPTGTWFIYDEWDCLGSIRRDKVTGLVECRNGSGEIIPTPVGLSPPQADGWPQTAVAVPRPRSKRRTFGVMPGSGTSEEAAAALESKLPAIVLSEALEGQIATTREKAMQASSIFLGTEHLRTRYMIVAPQLLEMWRKQKDGGMRRHQPDERTLIAHVFTDSAQARLFLTRCLEVEYAQAKSDMRRYDIIGARILEEDVGGRVGLTLHRIDCPGLEEKRPNILRGDVVIAKRDGLSQEGEEGDTHTGYVHFVNIDHVLVSFDQSFVQSKVPGIHQEADGERVVFYHVIFVFLDINYKRQLLALRTSETLLTWVDTPELHEEAAKPEMTHSPLWHLSPSVASPSGLGGSPVGVEKKQERHPPKWVESFMHLNAVQRQAVVRLSCSPVTPGSLGIFLLHGPPGTGKTTTLVMGAEAILRTKPNETILVATPSNQSANLIVERLVARFKSIPLLLDPELEKDEERPTTATGFTPLTGMVRLCAPSYDMRKECSSEILPYCCNMGVTKQRLEGVKIVVTTMMSCGVMYGLGVNVNHFDHILVDEAAQATETELLVPLQFASRKKGTRIALVGDHKQLGPVLRSKVCEAYDYHLSTMERLMESSPDCESAEERQEGGGVRHRHSLQLIESYRAHPGILNLYNTLSYKGTLRPCRATEELSTSTPQYSLVDLLGHVPAKFLHVAGAEKREGGSPSWMNQEEVDAVIGLIEWLLVQEAKDDQPRVRPADIVVLTPYNKQCQVIKGLIHDRFQAGVKPWILPPGHGSYDRRQLLPIEVCSVEAFQGREARVVILSCVRSKHVTQVTQDLKQSIGFLQQPKRMNVAISRAQAGLLIVGNAGVLQRDHRGECWLELLRMLLEQGCILNGEALVDRLSPQPRCNSTTGSSAPPSSSSAEGGGVGVIKQLLPELSREDFDTLGALYSGLTDGDRSSAKAEPLSMRDDFSFTTTTENDDEVIMDGEWRRLE